MTDPRDVDIQAAWADDRRQWLNDIGERDQRIAELEAKVKALELAGLERLRSGFVARIRAEAFEEAARVAEHPGPWADEGNDIAAAIRALKGRR